MCVCVLNLVASGWKADIGNLSYQNLKIFDMEKFSRVKFLLNFLCKYLEDLRKFPQAHAENVLCLIFAHCKAYENILTPRIS